MHEQEKLTALKAAFLNHKRTTAENNHKEWCRTLDELDDAFANLDEYALVRKDILRKLKLNILDVSNQLSKTNANMVVLYNHFFKCISPIPLDID